MISIAVLVSGNGTNLQAIIDNVNKGYIPARIALVLSDEKKAFALERAKKAEIETVTLDKKDYSTREDFDREVVRHLKKKEVEVMEV